MKLLVISGDVIARYEGREKAEAVQVFDWSEVSKAWLETFRLVGKEAL